MKTILEELNQTAQINWNSWSQVNKVLKSLGVNTEFFDKKTGELKESVSANALKNQTHPIVERYLEYKEWFKLSSSYGTAFLKKINPRTGRIHSSYNQVMSSGRTSSSNPNLQQIPRIPEFRECFRAPEGYVFITADFSN
jgi:DNA polymerase I-like protein with 3'-5' exonuclease and polymerase domains